MSGESQEKEAAAATTSRSTSIMPMRNFLFLGLYALAAAGVAVLGAVATRHFSIHKKVNNRLVEWLFIESPEEVFEGPSDPRFGIPTWMELEGQVMQVKFAEIQQLDDKVPMIIKHSPVKSWAALTKWKPEYLSQQLGLLTAVKRKTSEFPNSSSSKIFTNSVFLYESNQLLMRRWDADGKIIPFPQYEKINMTVKDFFSSDSNSEVMYYQKDLPNELEDDTNPRDFMLVIDDESFNYSSANFNMHMWFSRGNVQVGLHHDLAHNMFAQVSGCKRFVIVDPSQWRKLRYFPRDHPHHRQSQLELDEVAAQLKHDKFPTGWVADLAPGDMLYLPPGFAHRVSAYECNNQSVSISVNTWSYGMLSRLSQASTTLKNMPKMFVEPSMAQTRILKASSPSADQGSNPKSEMLSLRTVELRALAFYLKEVLTGVIGVANAREFLVDAVSSEILGSQKSLADALHCSGFDAAQCPSFVKDVNLFAEEYKELADELATSAQAMIHIFRQFPELDPALIEKAFADHIQRVIVLVTSFSHLCRFTLCLASIFTQ